MSTSDKKTVDGTLFAFGRELELLSARGREGLSELFRYDVVAEATLPVPSVDEMVGAPAQLMLRAAGAQRTVSGYVESVQVLARDNDKMHVSLRLRPHVHRQSIGRDCYAWQDVNVVDLIQHRLSDVGMPVRYELGRSYDKAEYRSQYREDDWTFLCRSMEEEGIFYWFDHSGGETTLVFGDDSRAADDLEGGAPILFRFEGFSSEDEVIHDLGSQSTVISHKWTLGSFDPVKPRLRIRGESGGGRLEMYDCSGGGPTTSAACTRRTVTQQEESGARRRTIAGRANSVRLVPGRVVEIYGHPVSSLNGRYLVTEAELAAPHQHKEGLTTFKALAVDTPYRPRFATPPAKQAGIQMGVVIGAPGAEVHPSELGQVRVQLHWDRTGKRDDKSGTWMRVAQRGAPGSMLIPRIGWNVATFNEEGAVDAPSVLCRIHDAEHPPAYALPDNKTRVVFKTATTPGGGSFNEIYFEDKSGAEEMFIHASRDMTVFAKNDKVEQVENDSWRTVGNRHERWIDGNADESVSSDQFTTVGGDETLKVGEMRSRGVSSNEVHSIGGSRTLKVGAGFAQSTKNTRTLKCPVQIDISLGQISEEAKFTSTLVGGALVRVSAQTIDEQSKIVTLDTVGGARIEIAKAARTLDVGKYLFELVGGVLTINSDENFIDGAHETSKWLVGAALSGKAKEIVAQAEEDVRIKCGATTITVTKDEIRFESTKIDLSGAKIDASASTIEHNS